MSRHGNNKQCMILWFQILSGIILLLVYFATPCCADCLKTSMRAALQAGKEQDGCRQQDDWSALTPQTWSWRNCPLSCRKRPEMTCDRCMPAGDDSPRSGSCPMTAFKTIDGDACLLRNTTVCSSKAASWSTDRYMTWYRDTSLTTWMLEWHRLSRRPTRTPGLRCCIDFSVIIGDKLWWKGRCGRKSWLFPLFQRMRPKRPWSRKQRLWAMTMITTGSHEAALIEAGHAAELPMSLGGVVVGACMLAVAFGSSGHFVWTSRRPGTHHGRRQVLNTLRAKLFPQVSPPGPKSRAKVVTWLHHRWAHMAFIMINLVGPARAGHLGDVRVGPPPAGGSRAFQAKHAGSKSTLASGSNKGPKRALLRAQSRARASPFGGTWYRGRFLSAKQLGTDRSDEANKIRETRNEMPRTQSSAPRLRIATWNCGSLGNKYQEVLYWLKSEYREGRPVDILAVQETGWKMDMEYKTAQDDRLDPQWFIINSGSGSTEGGVLFFISTKLVKSDDIRWVALHDGRALHVRLMLSPPLDLLNVYQYAWNPNKQGADKGQHKTEALIRQRMGIWKSIRNWLGQVPRRHGCILLGGFNTPLQVCPGLIGGGLAKQSGKPVQSD